MMEALETVPKRNSTLSLRSNFSKGDCLKRSLFGLKRLKQKLSVIVLEGIDIKVGIKGLWRVVLRSPIGSVLDKSIVFLRSFSFRKISRTPSVNILKVFEESLGSFL